MVGTYIFYADIYLIQNFLIKATVLYLALYCNRQHAVITKAGGMGKILLAALVGAVVEIAGLLAVPSFALFSALLVLGEIPFMVLFVTGRKQKGILSITMSMYFFTMILNAVLEIIWNRFGRYGNYLLWVLLACVAVLAGTAVLRRYAKEKKGIYLVELYYGGRMEQTYGFYDSGNRLCDPYTQKGVHIVSEKVIRKLNTDFGKKVLIPYQALGNEKGLVEVYYVERMRIYGTKDILEMEKIPLGVTKESLFEGRRYEMILNGEVF